MGHSRQRPIVGQTATGVHEHYIILDSYCDEMNVQVVANGTVTFTVDWTNQNILYDDATQKAVNIHTAEPDLVDPGSAVWTNLIASGSASAVAQFDYPAFALRIDITAGTGSVSYHVNQG